MTTRPFAVGTDRAVSGATLRMQGLYPAMVVMRTVESNSRSQRNGERCRERNNTSDPCEPEHKWNLPLWRGVAAKYRAQPAWQVGRRIDPHEARNDDDDQRQRRCSKQPSGPSRFETASRHLSRSLERRSGISACRSRRRSNHRAQHCLRGKGACPGPTGERRLSESYPWVIAFAFGLLHEFGPGRTADRHRSVAVGSSVLRITRKNPRLRTHLSAFRRLQREDVVLRPPVTACPGRPAEPNVRISLQSTADVIQGRE